MTDVITNPSHLDSIKSWTAAARSLLAPPQYIDEDRGRVAALLHTILMIMITATLLGFFAMINHPNPSIVASALSLLLFVELITFGLLRLKKERLSALILVSGLWLSFISLAAISEGLANSAFFGLVLVVTIAGLTLGGRAGLIFAGLSGFAGLGLMIGKANNLLPNGLIAFETFSFWALATVILLAAAGMIQLATNGLKKASDRAKNNELLQVEANRELQLVQANLEQIIQSRTQDLQNRSRYLQATIEVSRVASALLDDESLMNQAVDRIQSQFGLYYVGLFLLDSSREWAVLRSGTGEAGKAMLARGHRIRIGAGMVGWSITNAQPRIASEIEGDSVRLATPELPQTRSEAAFPLRARGQVIGALTIQSAVSAAFGETEISTFQTLADQIAIALENARLFAESRQDLQKAQLTAREITSKAWNAYLKGGADLDFRYDKGQITAAVADQEDQSSRLSLPIPLRDQFLGKIHFHKGDSKPWAEEEVAMLSSIVEQIGIALDSARLYQETRRRAERERLTGEITARFRQTNNSQEILQTAVVELCRALQADRARLYLNTPEAEIKIASDDLQNNG